MEVSELVKKAIDEVNSAEMYKAEKKIQSLVHSILDTNQKISDLAEHLISLKKELKALELPATKSLEL